MRRLCLPLWHKICSQCPLRATNHWDYESLKLERFNNVTDLKKGLKCRQWSSQTRVVMTQNVRQPNRGLNDLTREAS